MTKQRFNIQGMQCVGCVMNVEGALEDLKGVKSFSVSYAKQIADVEYDETRVTPDQIIAAIFDAGYKASAGTAEVKHALRVPGH